MKEPHDQLQLLKVSQLLEKLPTVCDSFEQKLQNLPPTALLVKASNRGFEMRGKLPKVDIRFSLIKTPTIEKMVLVSRK